MDWSKFDKKINVNEINDGIKELPEGEFEELPDGKYEVSLDSAELKPTKKDGYPMLAMCFTIVAGEYENRKIFVNQVLVMGDENDKYRVKSCNELLIGLGSSQTVSFNSVKEYEELINAIDDECNGMEYLIQKKSKTSKKDGKSYSSYKILEAYE